MWFWVTMFCTARREIEHWSEGTEKRGAVSQGEAALRGEVLGQSVLHHYNKMPDIVNV
jgi:hypothetical protein